MVKFKLKDLSDYDKYAIDPKQIEDKILEFVGRPFLDIREYLEEINESIKELQDYGDKLSVIAHKDIIEYLKGLSVVDALFLIQSDNGIGHEDLIYTSIEFPSTIMKMDYNDEVFFQLTAHITEYDRRMKEWYRFVESFIQSRTYAIFKKGVVIYVNGEGIIVTDKEVPKESLDAELQDNLRKLIKKYGKTTIERNMKDLVE